MSKMSPKQPSPLVQAALALEDELRRLGSLSREAQRLPLDSQRNLERAANKLAELSGVDERLQPLVHGLLVAVQGLVDSQQQEAAALAARAQQLEERRAMHQRLGGMFEMLAQGAQRLNNLVQNFAATWRGGSAEPGDTPSLREVLESMDLLIDGAAQLSGTAKQENFQDIARQADSLRQQIATARSKLNHLAPTADTAAPILH